jgi:hypothetical protein
MKAVQAYFTENEGWVYLTDKQQLKKPLVIVFGGRFLLEDQNKLQKLKEEFPYEDIVYGSTAGEIAGPYVMDDSLSVTAIEFEKSSFVVKSANIFDFDKDEEKLGRALYDQMPHEGLKHLFAVSTGSFINCSMLISGIEENIPVNVALTGGVCGDGNRFERTVASYKTDPKEGEVVLIGFYGESLEVTYASFGGFQPFGPERTITRSDNNVVYEIDGQSALGLYNKYLEERVENIMESRLAYPLNVIQPGKDYPVVRTILELETNDGSIVLAGNCEENSRAQLMMGSIHGIVQGAEQAAKYAMGDRKNNPQLALLVSCMGRKAIMGQRVEEEVELIKEIIGTEVPVTGFYSYAEMAPVHDRFECEVHNQTMTLTLFSE